MFGRRVILGALVVLATALSALAADDAPVTGKLTYRDTRIGTLPARSWTIYYPRFTKKPLGAERDPRFNVDYPLRRYVQCRTGEDVDVRFVVHYLKPEDLPLANRTGALLASLFWIGHDYLNMGPPAEKYLDVWLSHEGQAGGEEVEGNIYLLGIDESRAPAEWVRELAHEYAHAIIPHLGEFKQPEKWASGYLGERLLMKWLLADNGVKDAWSEPIDGTVYVARQVTPLRDRFLDLGPSAPLSLARDKAGMDFLIGEITEVEALYGPLVTRGMLRRFTEADPQFVGINLGAALLEQPPTGIPLNPDACIPAASSREGGRFKTAAYWLYTPTGTWQLDAVGANTATISAKVDGESARTSNIPGGVRLDLGHSANAGSWRKVELIAAPGQTVEIRSLVQRRAAAI